MATDYDVACHSKGQVVYGDRRRAYHFGDKVVGRLP